MPVTEKEFSEPVIQNPPELSPEQIERVVELTGFARQRVKTVIEVSSRAGLGRTMRDAITMDLVMIFCALHGLSTQQLEKTRSYYEIPF